MSPLELYIVIGLILMSVVEKAVEVNMGMSLIEYLRMIFNIMAPLWFKPYDTEGPNLLSKIYYILAYLMYPITIALILSKF